ncbi:MAG: Ferrichrome-iron receptor precursor [Syntrophorhabdus sp. PtaU1.Bin050]|nr:MAG: Ferrichrome-iron receptor precursor [Syntrophorhabdus sp. PtaU1.Bin050]
MANSDVPGTVVTVPQKVIEDQGIITQADAVRNVAGVWNYYPSYTGLSDDSFYIRGFSSSETLKNGLWVYDGGGNTWMGNVERVEVLKGPAGLLYGAYGGSIGGIVNVVTKKPLTEPRYSLTFMTDTEGSTSVIADASQPLNKSKTWLIRAIGEKGHYATFVDNNSRNTENFNIILQGLITPKDAITLEYEHLWQETHPYRGALSEYALVGSGLNARLIRLPGYNPQINLYDPRTNYTFETNAGRLVYEHQFNPDWSVKSSTRYSHTLDDSLVISASPTYNARTGISTYRLSRNAYHFSESLVDTDLMAHGKFNTWKIKHDTIFGVRAASMEYSGHWRYSYNSWRNYTFTDPNNPPWGLPETDPPEGTVRYYKRYQFNYYVNDVVSLTDKLKVVAGINHARYGRHQSGWSGGGGRPMTEFKYDVIQDGDTWRAGLLYEVWPGITPYFSYSTTFCPQWWNLTDDGVLQSFDPLTGRQYEWGVKIDIPNRATITASVYQLNLENVLSSDPDPVRSSLGYEVQGGTQKSRGYEVDATVKLAPGWDALVSYAHTEWEYGDSASFVRGSNSINSPKHSFRLWSVYEFQPGSFLAGFGFGGGVTARSRTELNYTRKSTPYATGTLPGYGVLDGVLYYKYKGTKLGIFKDSKFSINLTNILDKNYWASGSYSSLYRGEPFKATFRWEQTF